LTQAEVEPLATDVLAPSDLKPPSASLSSLYLGYALVILLVIQTLAFVDRQIISILAEPLKHAFRLKDWQLGLLSGSAFAIFYTTLGVPIARVAERTHRPRIIGLAAGAWSVFTVAAAFTTTFPQLLLTRLGVGVGEAGAVPVGHSLICSYVSQRRRAAALAFFSAGLPLGTLVGMAVGGLMADAYGWRAAFLVAGLPGFVAAGLAAFTLKEPRRNLAAQPAMGLMEVARRLGSSKAFVTICGAATLWAFTANGMGAFTAAFFMRCHHGQLVDLAHQVSAATGWRLGPTGLLGLALGLSSGLFGAMGTIIGGPLTDALMRRDRAAYLTVLALSRIVGIPLALAAVIVPDPAVALGLIAIGAFFSALGTGGLYASVQSLVPPELRATASAVFSLVVNATALTLGPLCAGLLSDTLAVRLGSAEGLRWSLITLHVLSATCIWVYWSGRKVLVREMVS